MYGGENSTFFTTCTSTRSSMKIKQPNNKTDALNETTKMKTIDYSIITWFFLLLLFSYSTCYYRIFAFFLSTRRKYYFENDHKRLELTLTLATYRSAVYMLLFTFLLGLHSARMCEWQPFPKRLTFGRHCIGTSDQFRSFTQQLLLLLLCFLLVCVVFLVFFVVIFIFSSSPTLLFSTRVSFALCFSHTDSSYKLSLLTYTSTYDWTFASFISLNLVHSFCRFNFFFHHSAVVELVAQSGKLSSIS